jgi:hypothetical protein
MRCITSLLPAETLPRTCRTPGLALQVSDCRVQYVHTVAPLCHLLCCALYSPYVLDGIAGTPYSLLLHFTAIFYITTTCMEYYSILHTLLPTSPVLLLQESSYSNYPNYVISYVLLCTEYSVPSTLN